MKFSHFFINRPIFACVISILITLVGAIAFFQLPVSQYPEIVPPTVNVVASYSGASPEVIMNTVVSPLEQEINGVEKMIYMQSHCSADGRAVIRVTFETGTDPNMAQVMVQNRVNVAQSRLPKEVRDKGVTVRKVSPDLLLTINLYSPNGTRDKLYLSNYAITQMQDKLSRVYGVSEFNVWGSKEYSMRIWMDPDRLANVDLSPMQVIEALQEQNKQVAAGKLNAPPSDRGAAFELIINAHGRLQTEKEFGNIVVKRMPDGRIVHLRDVATIELGSYTYGSESYINGKSSVSMGAYQLPGSNAVEVAKNLRAEIEEMKKNFPNDVDYVIGQDNTAYITESVNEVYKTIFDAVILVIIVVMVFLQRWRAAIIPLFAIPVSLVGTFAMMYLMDFSINNLTLFGLVLAIGIVVDDAIVVVENVERNMREGLNPREATHKAMTQVQGALIAIVLVLSCVFFPTAFIGGISGQFYKQFAITIATSTIISGLVSLTLTPALCAILIREKEDDIISKIWNFLFGWFFRFFNFCFEKLAYVYGRSIAHVSKFALIALLLYGGLIWLTVDLFKDTPTGFIPKQDQGYFSASIKLPDGASFERTEETVAKAAHFLQGMEAIRYVSVISGSDATGSSASNNGRVVMMLADRALRDSKGWTSEKIMAQVRGILEDALPEAQIQMVSPASVRGIGGGGDLKFQLQDMSGLGVEAVERYSNLLVEKINELDCISQAFTTFRAANPQLYAEIDRERAQKLNVSISSIFTTMQYNLGSVYVNDFNILGRVYRVVAQAEGNKRQGVRDIYNLKVPNALGQNVPLGSVLSIKRIVGPDRLTRYNLYSSSEVYCNTVKGYSSGYAIAEIERLARENLPQGMDIEWTDLAYQEKKAGNTSLFIFGASVLFVFLLLSALYESWTLPLSVILIVPLVLLFSIMGVYYRGLDNNIMVQIGFVVLIGLACKNAILIVEFAKQRQENGEDLVSALSHASSNRLRPILMTSFAFILGVVPLAYGTGAGYELRQAIGTSVLFGMLGVTFFGCIFTPIFYYIIRRIFDRTTSALPENFESEN